MYPGILEFKSAWGFPLTTQNRSAFAHAFHQFFEHLSVRFLSCVPSMLAAYNRSLRGGYREKVFARIEVLGYDKER